MMSKPKATNHWLEIGFGFSGTQQSSGFSKSQQVVQVMKGQTCPGLPLPPPCLTVGVMFFFLNAVTCCVVLL